MHLFPARVFMDPGPLPGQFVLGIRELKFNLGVNLNSRVKRQLPGPGCFQLYSRELFVELF